jgi:hypothetical protein
MRATLLVDDLIYAIASRSIAQPDDLGLILSHYGTGVEE